ncbi:MAG: hypothetical protein OEW45_08830 [Deltaproteobacteria bacterium]|nr:hypothetical protein [Deltaproteobacteria bacterium]
MTHTLHRRGDNQSLQEDYVVLIMPAQGVNVPGSDEKLKKLWEIFSRYNVVNFGNGNHNKFTLSLKDLKKKKSMIGHAVFKDKETLTQFVKELKEADLGLSTVLSGLYDEVKDCCGSLGIKLHTVEHSLGVHGNTKKLPSENVLEIHTMCGHALIAPKLIEAMVDSIKKGKQTPEAAAEELARQCSCGVFNPYRAAKLLKKMASL